MRRLMASSSAEPEVDRDDTSPARRPGARRDVEVEALSPAAIIARAAATVPNESEGDGPASEPAPARQPDDTLVLPNPRPSSQPSVRPNRRARRRPYALIASRVRRAAYSSRRAPLLLLLFGVPALMWQTGMLDSTLDRVGTASDRMVKGAQSAMNLRLGHLKVRGRRRTSVADLRQAAAVGRGQDLMAIDLGALRGRLEALPWVSRVAVERRLPDTLVVRIEEHRPIARYRIGSRTILVSETGMAIPIQARPEHERLIILAGEGAPEAALELLSLLAKAPRLNARVAAAVRRGQRRWDILFANRVMLKLPERHQETAWLKFATLNRRHGLLDRGAASFDMRLRDRFVVQPGSNTTKTSG